MSDNDLLVAKALAVAEAAHDGQVDKAGVRYIEHVCSVHKRVLVYLKRFDYTKTAQANIECIALLHDVPEDTGKGFLALYLDGFPIEVVRSLRLLTKPQWVPYHDYIWNIIDSGDSRAMLVKFADNEDNLDPDRIKAAKRRASTGNMLALDKLAERYTMSRDALRAAMKREWDVEL